MSTTNSQRVFQLCSYLLNYPNQDFIESLQDVKEELDSLSCSDAKSELTKFCEKASNLSLSELVSSYINTFDFGKKTNLYITYMSNGEQRERGVELLFLKNYYKLHGFDVTDKELPDYLPVLLEFAGQVDMETIKPLFERYLSNIEEIAKNLDTGNNLYSHVMKAILFAFKEVGITNTVQRSVAL